MAKWHKWVVEFQVEQTWVEDGFDLTDERAKRMLAYDLQSAYGSELKAKVIDAPQPEVIAKAQGYEGETLNQGVKAVLKTRKDGKL